MITAPENPGRKSNVNWSGSGENNSKVGVSTYKVDVAKPLVLFTNQRTDSPPVVNTVVKPAAGIGHSGNWSAAMDNIGPSSAPIVMVIVDHSPTIPVQLIGRTCNSKLPYQPSLQSMIPVFWFMVPGLFTSDPTPGCGLEIFHSNDS